MLTCTVYWFNKPLKLRFNVSYGKNIAIRFSTQRSSLMMKGPIKRNVIDCVNFRSKCVIMIKTL